MKPVIALPEHRIVVKQSTGRGKRFSVSYGLQKKTGLTYKDAAFELGRCLFHSLACEALLDNEGD